MQYASERNFKESYMCNIHAQQLFLRFLKIRIEAHFNFQTRPLLARCNLQIHKNYNCNEDFSLSFDNIIPMRSFAFNLLLSILQNCCVDKKYQHDHFNMSCKQSKTFSLKTSLSLTSNSL